MPCVALRSIVIRSSPPAADQNRVGDRIQQVDRPDAARGGVDHVDRGQHANCRHREPADVGRDPPSRTREADGAHEPVVGFRSGICAFASLPSYLPGDRAVRAIFFSWSPRFFAVHVAGLCSCWSDSNMVSTLCSALIESEGSCRKRSHGVVRTTVSIAFCRIRGAPAGTGWSGRFARTVASWLTGLRGCSVCTNMSTRYREPALRGVFPRCADAKLRQDSVGLLHRISATLRKARHFQ